MPKKRTTGTGKRKCITKHLKRFLDKKCDASEVVKHLFLDAVLHKLAYDVIEAAQTRWINTPIEMRSEEYSIAPFVEELCSLREKYSDLQLLLTYLKRTSIARIKSWFVLKTEFRGHHIDIQRIPEWGFEFRYMDMLVTLNERTRAIEYEKISGE